MTVTMFRSASRPRSNLISGTLAGVLGIAGLIHCLLMPDHFAASTILGLGFLSAAVAQIGLAALVLFRPQAWVYTAVIGVSVVLMGLYAFNVAVGLPFHAAQAEPSVVADADGHATDGDHGGADGHGSDDHHPAADERGADDHHGAAGSHGTDEDHGSAADEDGHGAEGLAIGAGEPVDAWGATTQLAQLSSVGLALMLLRRRP